MAGAKAGHDGGGSLATPNATSAKSRAPEPPRSGGAYPITCIVSQVAASAGFSVPSISTLTS